MITEFSPIPEGFFGENGLTATSANHIANLLKLRYETIENELDSLNFVTEKMSIVGSEVENLMRSARVIPLEDIRVKLDEVARCKGFIAFLREAIKCKSELAQEIEDFQSPMPAAPLAPIPERPVSEQAVIAGWSVGERVKFLATEARAATYGKYIHPGGVLDKARGRAYEAFMEPTKVAMAGRDTAFIKRETAVSTAEIDAVMMNLQAEHRRSEAELNGYKHDVEYKAQADAQRKLDEYREKKQAHEKAVAEYERQCDAIALADKQARLDRRKLIEELKIIIPNQYRDLYNAVNNG